MWRSKVERTVCCESDLGLGVRHDVAMTRVSRANHCCDELQLCIGRLLHEVFDFPPQFCVIFTHTIMVSRKVAPRLLAHIWGRTYSAPGQCESTVYSVGLRPLLLKSTHTAVVHCPCTICLILLFAECPLSSYT